MSAPVTVNRLYFFPKPNRWQRGIGMEMPEAYKKFWNEWKIQKPAAVHYIPKEGKYEWNDRLGRVIPVQNIPLPLKRSKQMDEGIWGGESIVQGFQKKGRYCRRVPKFWIPRLVRSVVYSEVLDMHIKTLVTRRTLELIHDNYGFDHYLLKTPACDLNSLLALKIKRQILMALFDQTLYPNDEEKRLEIYNRYKDYLAPYTREEIEWYGLSWEEAIRKLLNQLEKNKVVQPLKHVYRSELIANMKEAKISEAVGVNVEKPSESWLSRVNPFANSKKAD